MGVLKVLFAIVAAFLLAAVLVGGCVYSGYNKVVRMDQRVETEWAEVDNQLQRRFDLIPNVVEAVKGVAAHEKEVFLGIAKSREAYFQANTVREKAKAATAFESALSRLLVLREQYPKLRANEAFLKLQDQLEGTENRIAVARKRYNDAVGQLNGHIRTLWGRLSAALAGVDKAAYFEIDEEARKRPEVDFGAASGDKPDQDTAAPETAPAGATP